MSINKTDIIDVISTSPKGPVTLTISDHHTWEETWHLKLLQDKINAYLQFIETGQIFKDYPNAIGKEIVIKAAMKFEPNQGAVTFLQKAKEIIKDAGYNFQWDVIKLDE
jgi:hypothetical protein